MKKFWLFCLLLSAPVMADTIHGRADNNTDHAIRVDTEGGVVTALGECEDDTNNLCRVEHYYSYSVGNADKSVKASAGFVHTISCWGEDAAATAGRVRLLDSTSAGAGTAVWGEEFSATQRDSITALLDVAFATGIYLDFTTTADVSCTVSYR